MIITQTETVNFPPFHPIKTKKNYQKFPPVSPIPLQTFAPPRQRRRPLHDRDAATSREGHAAQLYTDQLPNAAHVQLRQAHAARLLRRLTTTASAKGIRKKIIPPLVSSVKFCD